MSNDKVMKWIDITERLPEVDSKPYFDHPEADEAYASDYVLICYKTKYGREISIGQLFYYKEDGAYIWDAYTPETGDVDGESIVAWMPLPEPYEEN